MNDTSGDTICMQLAALTSAIASTPLASEIIEETRLCFLDFIASTLAAPMTPAVTEMTKLFGSGQAKMLHNSAPASVAGAAFVHGYLSTVEDIDDAHALASGMHLSATVFPAALAITQSKGTMQRDFMRAAVAGYEVAGRLARSMDQGLRTRGFHASGAIGPFATCAAACILLDLDQQQMAHAFGMAASGAGGLFAFLSTGADSRHLHAANASVAGLVAATAAKNGNTGPLTAFEGPDGFIGPYSETCDMAFISTPPPGDDDYEMLNAYHKRFTACGHAIPAITLALELRHRDRVPTDQIKSVELFGYPASAKLTNFPAATVSEAKFSLPIVFALAYLYGDVSPAEMNMSVINRPEVQSLAQKVQVKEKPEHRAAFPDVRSGSVRIRLTKGQTLTLGTTTPIGMQGNRLSFSDIANKILVLAHPVLGDERCTRAIEAVSALTDSGEEFTLF
ncbi:MAG: MmgE/PrpD family protein [Novosphingobium sp.]|nr:MmgE/PrpD family protein [Novosphingobium sp.]